MNIKNIEGANLKQIEGADAEDLAQALKMGTNGDGRISEEWLLGFLAGIRWARSRLQESTQAQSA